MPERTRSSDIEDVLGSIRRLVSEEASARPKAPRGGDRLVLTPDYRVGQPEAPGDAPLQLGEPVAGAAASSSPSIADELAELEAKMNQNAERWKNEETLPTAEGSVPGAGDPAPEAGEPAHAAGEPAPEVEESVAAIEDSPLGEADPAPVDEEQAVVAAETTPEPEESGAAAEARAAEIEEAAPAAEDLAVEDDDEAEKALESALAAEESAPEVEDPSPEAVDNVLADEDPAPAAEEPPPDVNESASAEAEAAAATEEPEPEAEEQPASDAEEPGTWAEEEAAEVFDAWEPAGEEGQPGFRRMEAGASGAETMLEEPPIEADVVRLATAAPLANLPDNVGKPDVESLLDEAELRALVAEVLREELKGPLGERITRNVRKLVRREIAQALSSMDID